jgi:hypothetical protein
MVRTGLTQDGTVIDLQEQLSATIAQLRQDLQQTPSLFPDVDVIRLHTVEAEHLYQSGLHREAAAKLKPFWDSWEDRVRQWKLPNQPLEPSGDRRLLRQKIWALMHYVFYDFYAVQADYLLAIKHFHAIERVIGQELEEHTSRREDRRREDRAMAYKPYGTWAVFHYFVGHCHRATRNFSAAESHFSTSLQFLRKRLERKLLEAEDPSRIDPSVSQRVDANFEIDLQQGFYRPYRRSRARLAGAPRRPT